MDKVMPPEMIGLIPYELNEGDEQSPGMRSVHYQSL